MINNLSTQSISAVYLAYAMKWICPDYMAPVCAISILRVRSMENTG